MRKWRSGVGFRPRRRRHPRSGAGRWRPSPSTSPPPNRAPTGRATRQASTLVPPWLFARSVMVCLVPVLKWERAYGAGGGWVCTGTLVCCEQQ
jgi:hypothetical protein